MHFKSAGTALVLKRASLGPAAIALRAARRQPYGQYLSHPMGLSLTRGGSAGAVGSAFRTMRGLGDTGPSSSVQLQTAAKGAGISIGAGAAGVAAATSLASV